MTPAEKILQKTLETSGLDSSQWNQVHAGLRDRAFFSSRVESARFLHAARGQIAGLAAGTRSASEIRRDLRKLLESEGYASAAGDEGGIKDLRSQSRLDVLIETNARQARGYVQQLEGNTPGALSAFPAQELIRTRRSQAPRDWTSRWRDAGGRLYGGRMAALKGDPVWIDISRFGVPWPPFDFGSGMGVQDLSREEALSLGVIRADDPPPAAAVVPGFNSALEAEVPFPGRDSPEWQWLKDSFGDQVRYQPQPDGTTIIKWQNEILKEALHEEGDPGAVVRFGKVTPAALKKAEEAGLSDMLANKSFSPDRTWLRNHVSRHVGENERRRDNVPITEGDLDLLPTIWRNPDKVNKSDAANAEFVFAAFDGVFHLYLDLYYALVPKTLYKTKR